MQDARGIHTLAANAHADQSLSRTGWQNRRVTLMGLGRHGGGVGAARWLLSQGADLTITDLASAEDLADSIAALADLPAPRWRLGEHVDEDFASPDCVIVNPAVRPDDRWLEIARRSGVRITSETELFLRACPAVVIGVTGSNGKSTTAALTAAILEADGRRTWLGGNIGRSLLAELDTMRPEDVVVLELSSFQLHYLAEDVLAPHVAVITNCSANHLDWHSTYEHYAAAKQRLLALQTADDVAVLNPTCREVSRWKSLVRGRCLTELFEKPVPPLQIPGEHNRTNASLAAVAARAVGGSEAAIDRGLRTFRGLPHRLQFVAEIDGRRYFNDSKATTPEAAMAALSAFSEPVWILLGGHAKGGDYESLARGVATHARGVACYGRAGDMLAEQIAEHNANLPCFRGETLADALHWCREQSQWGDIILLSPACASFDQFRDYAERGECFRSLTYATA